MRSAWRNIHTFFNDVAEENSSAFVGQRYDKYVADLSVRHSGAAEVGSARVLAVLGGDGGGLVSSVALQAEAGPEVMVRVPKLTLQPDGRENELLQALRGKLMVPQTDLDNFISTTLKGLPLSLSLAVSICCLHLGAVAVDENSTSYMGQVEKDVARLVDDDAATSLGRVPLVAPALGTSSILSCLCLAPTLCETFSEYVGTMSRTHGQSGTTALAADDSSLCALQRTVSLIASRTPGALLIVCVNRTLQRALRKLKGLDTPADAGSSHLVREFVEALATCSGVEHILVVGMDGSTMPSLASARVHLCDVNARARGKTSPPPSSLQVGADGSAHRTVTTLSLALSNAGVLVLPAGSPLNSVQGTPILVGSSHLDVVAVRDTFPACVELLNELAVSNRDFVGRSISKLINKAAAGGSEQSLVDGEDRIRPLLARRNSSSSRRRVVRRRSSRAGI